MNKQNRKNRPKNTENKPMAAKGGGGGEQGIGKIKHMC